jgi:hypothetical protein
MRAAWSALYAVAQAEDGRGRLLRRFITGTPGRGVVWTHGTFRKVCVWPWTGAHQHDLRRALDARRNQLSSKGIISFRNQFGVVDRSSAEALMFTSQPIHR